MRVLATSSSLPRCRPLCAVHLYVLSPRGRAALQHRSCTSTPHFSPPSAAGWLALCALPLFSFSLLLRVSHLNFPLLLYDSSLRCELPRLRSTAHSTAQIFHEQAVRETAEQLLARWVHPSSNCLRLRCKWHMRNWHAHPLLSSCRTACICFKRIRVRADDPCVLERVSLFEWLRREGGSGAECWVTVPLALTECRCTGFPCVHAGPVLPCHLLRALMHQASRRLHRRRGAMHRGSPQPVQLLLAQL